MWWRNPEGNALVWHGGWLAPDLPGLATFALNSRKLTFAPGEGLTGQVWQQDQAIWNADIAANAPYPHSSEAVTAGLRAAVSVPVVNETGMLGVMTFLSTSPRQVDAHLLEVLTDMGQNIGQFVARKQAEAALQAERASLAQRVEERTADLSRSNAELAYAVRAKDEFLTNMSHELRTPLTAILAFLESLLEQTRGPLNERQLKSVAAIEQSGRHLLALINDILDLSKYEAGKLTIQPDSLLVEDICQASLLFVRELANKKRVSVAYQLDDRRTLVQADARRLKQILVNLLSNAVKFTPDGGQVSLTVTTDPAAAAIRFIVQDDGIGIAPQDLGRLFQPFTQFDSGLARQYEGSGLGLALVRRLVEMHGGSVAVTSEGVFRQGSRFTVTLPWQIPLQAAEAAHRAPATAAETRRAPDPPEQDAEAGREGPLILLAEDSEVTIEAIGDYLRSAGYRVALARNGREVLEEVPTLNPDVILMDIQMPVMDGFETMRRLRADPRFVSLPIIALTALAMPGDGERCLAAGASDYLAKPVSLKGLVQRIRHWSK